MSKMSYDKIYLSGPVEQSEDPNSWRKEIQEKHTFYNYIDPVEHIEVQLEGEYWRYRLVAECLHAVNLSDGVLIYWGKSEVTWGTPIEQYYAWLNGVPNVVYTDGNDVEIPAFMHVYADDIVSESERALNTISRLSHGN